MSLHQINVLEGLSLARKTGNAPQETVIIGIEPEKTDWGLGISPEIDKKIPDILNIVLEEVGNACYETETTK